MIEVIGAGLPRTGTLSLKAALERLGFGPCYHMFELYDHLELIDRWLPGVPETREGWERLFAGYRSCVDWPASFFWRPLAEAFPEARVILTVRDPRSWYDSFRGMIRLRVASMAQEAPSPEELEFRTRFARIQPLLRRIAEETFGAGGFPYRMPAPQQAVRAFERHVTTVEESLPPDRLLVFDVREGWEPLCSFLGAAVPEGEPFPRLNDLDAVKERFAALKTSL
ncbi:sulfotransferase family protein [Nonomuraea aridisoli]|uniref:sulfotransferase family protein n=1 Tax=Nonomuraea aridisoli TaxID=2070368 RepID=UPI001F45C5E0|nr:sulfotransferase family protein [Nonomuraea aridisoli]